ncbi:MAG: hypothetical protein IMZ64_03045 [Bacteroidetes bacterium]|nr:hypothetical protein [Bacteroidota bacterium]
MKKLIALLPLLFIGCTSTIGITDGCTPDATKKEVVPEVTLPIEAIPVLPVEVPNAPKA